MTPKGLSFGKVKLPEYPEEWRVAIIIALHKIRRNAGNADMFKMIEESHYQPQCIKPIN